MLFSPNCLCFFFVFFFSWKSSMVIHSFDLRVVFFFRRREKKNNFFIHSFDFLLKSSKSDLCPGKKNGTFGSAALKIRKQGLTRQTTDASQMRRMIVGNLFAKNSSDLYSIGSEMLPVTEAEQNVNKPRYQQVKHQQREIAGTRQYQSSKLNTKEESH